MEVRDAIAQAKAFLRSLYADEDVSQIRLEEVEFDEQHDSWLITLGIVRPSSSNIMGRLATPLLKRTYKIIKIPNDERSKPSMKIRELTNDD